MRAGSAPLAVAALTLAIVYAASEGAARASRWRTSAAAYQELQETHLARFQKRADAIQRELAGGVAGTIAIHKREFDWGPTQPDFPLAWVPPKTVLQPAPLAAAAVGPVETWPASYSVTPFNRDPMPVAEQPGNPLHPALGHFDLVFVTVVLLPLFVIALCYDFFAGERDDGTLALVLAQPVSPRMLLAGKYVARAGLAVLTPAALTVAALGWGAAGHAGGGLRLLLWVAFTLAYGVFWVGLAAWLNRCARPAAVNALFLGGAWLLLAVLAPAVLDGALQAMHPVPPRVEWVDAERLVTERARFQTVSVGGDEQRRVLRRFLAANPALEQDESRYTGALLLRALALAAGLQAARELEETRESFEGPRRAQERLLAKLRFLSPSILLQGALYDLAGAGRSRYDEFLRQTREHQQRVEGWAWDRRFQSPRISAQDYAAIPRFRFREETLADALRLAALPLLGLCVMAGALNAAAFRAARRLAPLH